MTRTVFQPRHVSRLRRMNLNLVIGAVLVGLIAVVGIVSIFWTPYPPKPPVPITTAVPSGFNFDNARRTA